MFVKSRLGRSYEMAVPDADKSDSGTPAQRDDLVRRLTRLHVNVLPAG
jgi:hypothetical protein